MTPNQSGMGPLTSWNPNNMGDPNYNTSLSPAGYGANIGADIGNLMSLFGTNSNYQNPANAAMPYLNQISPLLQQNLGPYVQAGMRQLPGLESNYNELINNPAALYSKFGSSFQQSPGYQWDVNQAIGAANRASAAGGMLGSPQEQQQIASTVNQLANQDFYNYMDRVTGMYGAGLQGSQGLYNTGQQTAQTMSEDQAQALMSQANTAYQGAANKNQEQSSFWGGLGSTLGDVAGVIASFL